MSTAGGASGAGAIQSQAMRHGGAGAGVGASRARACMDGEGPSRTGTDCHGRARTDWGRPVGGGPCEPVSSAQLAVNAALSLLNLCCRPLDRQLKAQAEGAFSLYGGAYEEDNQREGRK